MKERISSLLHILIWFAVVAGRGESRGVLSIKLREFYNPSGRTFDGRCCDADRRTEDVYTKCGDGCDYVMRLVVTGLGRANDHVFLFHRPLTHNRNDVTFPHNDVNMILTVLFDRWPRHDKVKMSAFFYDYDTVDHSTTLVDWFVTDLEDGTVDSPGDIHSQTTIGKRKRNKTKLVFDWSFLCTDGTVCVQAPSSRPQTSTTKKPFFERFKQVNIGKQADYKKWLSVNTQNSGDHLSKQEGSAESGVSHRKKSVSKNRVDGWRKFHNLKRQGMGSLKDKMTEIKSNQNYRDSRRQWYYPTQNIHSSLDTVNNIHDTHNVFHDKRVISGEFPMKHVTHDALYNKRVTSDTFYNNYAVSDAINSNQALPDAFSNKLEPSYAFYNQHEIPNDFNSKGQRYSLQSNKLAASGVKSNRIGETQSTNVSGGQAKSSRKLEYSDRPKPKHEKYSNFIKYTGKAIDDYRKDRVNPNDVHNITDKDNGKSSIKKFSGNRKNVTGLSVEDKITISNKFNVNYEVDIENINIKVKVDKRQEEGNQKNSTNWKTLIHRKESFDFPSIPQRPSHDAMLNRDPNKYSHRRQNKQTKTSTTLTGRQTKSSDDTSELSKPLSKANSSEHLPTTKRLFFSNQDQPKTFKLYFASSMNKGLTKSSDRNQHLSINIKKTQNDSKMHNLSMRNVLKNQAYSRSLRGKDTSVDTQVVKKPKRGNKGKYRFDNLVKNILRGKSNRLNSMYVKKNGIKLTQPSRQFVFGSTSSLKQSQFIKNRQSITTPQSDFETKYGRNSKIIKSHQKIIKDPVISKNNMTEMGRNLAKIKLNYITDNFRNETIPSFPRTKDTFLRKTNIIKESTNNLNNLDKNALERLNSQNKSHERSAKNNETSNIVPEIDVSWQTKEINSKSNIQTINQEIGNKTHISSSWQKLRPDNIKLLYNSIKELKAVKYLTQAPVEWVVTGHSAFQQNQPRYFKDNSHRTKPMTKLFSSPSKNPSLISTSYGHHFTLENQRPDRNPQRIQTDITLTQLYKEDIEDVSKSIQQDWGFTSTTPQISLTKDFINHLNHGRVSGNYDKKLSEKQQEQDTTRYSNVEKIPVREKKQNIKSVAGNNMKTSTTKPSASKQFQQDLTNIIPPSVDSSTGRRYVSITPSSHLIEMKPQNTLNYEDVTRKRVKSNFLLNHTMTTNLGLRHKNELKLNFGNSGKVQNSRSTTGTINSSEEIKLLNPNMKEITSTTESLIGTKKLTTPSTKTESITEIFSNIQSKVTKKTFHTSLKTFNSQFKITVKPKKKKTTYYDIVPFSSKQTETKNKVEEVVSDPNLNVENINNNLRTDVRNRSDMVNITPDTRGVRFESNEEIINRTEIQTMPDDKSKQDDGLLPQIEQAENSDISKTSYTNNSYQIGSKTEASSVKTQNIPKAKDNYNTFIDHKYLVKAATFQASVTSNDSKIGEPISVDRNSTTVRESESSTRIPLSSTMSDYTWNEGDGKTASNFYQQKGLHLYSTSKTNSTGKTNASEQSTKYLFPNPGMAQTLRNDKTTTDNVRITQGNEVNQFHQMVTNVSHFGPVSVEGQFSTRLFQTTCRSNEEENKDWNKREYIGSTKSLVDDYVRSRGLNNKEKQRLDKSRVDYIIQNWNLTNLVEITGSSLNQTEHANVTNKLLNFFNTLKLKLSNLTGFYNISNLTSMTNKSDSVMFDDGIMSLNNKSLYPYRQIIETTREILSRAFTDKISINVTAGFLTSLITQRNDSMISWIDQISDILYYSKLNTSDDDIKHKIYIRRTTDVPVEIKDGGVSSRDIKIFSNITSQTGNKTNYQADTRRTFSTPFQLTHDLYEDMLGEKHPASKLHTSTLAQGHNNVTGKAFFPKAFATSTNPGHITSSPRVPWSLPLFYKKFVVKTLPDRGFKLHTPTSNASITSHTPKRLTHSSLILPDPKLEKSHKQNRVQNILPVEVNINKLRNYLFEIRHAPGVNVPSKGLFQEETVTVLEEQEVTSSPTNNVAKPPMMGHVVAVNLRSIFTRYWPAVFGVLVGTVFLLSALVTSMLCRRRRLLIQRARWTDSPHHVSEPPDTSEYATSSAASINSDFARSSTNLV